MMHVDAPHPNCAYKWLEHSINPKLQGDLAAWFGSVPAVPDACKGNALLGEKGCETNGIDRIRQIAFWRRRWPTAATGATCVPYHEWVTELHRRHRRAVSGARRTARPPPPPAATHPAPEPPVPAVAAHPVSAAASATSAPSTR